MSLWNNVAFILAGSGVVFMAFNSESSPFISLTLAFLFGFYGLFKKIANVDPIAGLFIEFAVSFPFFLVLLSVRQINGTAAFGLVSPGLSALLVISGLMTCLPLIFFAQGANRVELSTVGFIQYVDPSIYLILGIFLSKRALPM